MRMKQKKIVMNLFITFLLFSICLHIPSLSANTRTAFGQFGSSGGTGGMNLGNVDLGYTIPVSNNDSFGGIFGNNTLGGMLGNPLGTSYESALNAMYGVNNLNITGYMNNLQTPLNRSGMSGLAAVWAASLRRASPPTTLPGTASLPRASTPS